MKRSMVVLALFSFQLVFAGAVLATEKPYCSVASSARNGAQWWTWSIDSEQAGCDLAAQKLANAGYPLDNPALVGSGTYFSDQDNTSLVVCGQGQLNSSGFGEAVFTNSREAFQVNNWSACVIYVNQDSP